MIADLAKVLTDAGLDPNVDELRDALWLAAHLPTEAASSRVGADERDAPVPANSGDSGKPVSDDLVVESPAPAPHHPPRAQSTAWSGPRTSVFVRSPNARGTAMAGVPVRIAAVPALRHQLELSRALKPLGRRVESDRLFEVDEEATADRIAEEGLWVPVLRPHRERWLTVALVVDSVPSMAVWRRTVDEFAALLARQGCFADVRRYQLDSAQHGRLGDPLGTADYANRGIVIVITDGVSNGWRNGESQRLLRHWARTAPVSIMTVLPQRMWRGTGLRMRPMEFTVPRPAAPNAHWQGAGSRDIRIPVFEMAPEWIRQWSALTTAAGGRHRAALLAPQAIGTVEHPDTRSEEVTDPAELVEIFRMTASPTAFELACYLAATTLVLPVMRMVQHVMLPESQLAHLAEVILGGLLIRWEPAPGTDPERVEYDFVPGVRHVLADHLTRAEIVTLLRASSEFVAGTIGSPFDLEAMLSDPDSVDMQTVTHTDGAEPIAWVAASLLARMEGKYRVLADRLMDRGPADTVAPQQVARLDGFDDRIAETQRHAMNRDYYVALSLLAALLDDCLSTVGPDHPNTLCTRSKLVEFALEDGNFDLAEEHHAGLVEKCLDVLGPDHITTLSARGCAADFTGYAGAPLTAVADLRKLILDCERVLGADHEDTLEARQNLANWTGEAGDYKTAHAMFHSVLADRTRVLGKDHPKTLTTRSNIAYETGQADDHAAAIELYQAVLLDRARVLGPDHPDTVNTRRQIATETSRAGNHAAAIELHQAVLVDVTRILGPDHRMTLNARHSIAYNTSETGDHAAALELFEHLLFDRVVALGPDHRDTLATRHNIAYETSETGNPAAALGLFQDLLRDRARVLGPDHPDTLAVRHQIAYETGKTGDHPTAIEAYRALLLDRARVIGPDHPDTLITRNNLAYQTGEAGNQAGAIELFQDLLRDRTRVLGAHHADTLNTHENLGHWIRKSGDHPTAVALYQDLLPTYIQVFGPTQYRVRTIRSYLAYWTAQSVDPTTASATPPPLSEEPGIVVWLELLAAAHLVGRPSPNPDRPWLTGLTNRFSLKQLGGVIERRLRISVETQDQWTHTETRPEELIAHLVDRAMSFLDGRDPIVCDGNETEWHTPEYLEYTEIFARSIRTLHPDPDPSEQFLGATEWLNLTTTWPVIAYSLTDMV